MTIGGNFKLSILYPTSSLKARGVPIMTKNYLALENCVEVVVPEKHT